MTLLGAIMREEYRRTRSGRRVFSNYINKEADYCDPDILIKAIDPYSGYNIKNGLLLIDEIHLAAMGRRAMNRVNVNLSMALTQIRKANLQLAFTSNSPWLVDKNVNRSVNFFIEPRRLGRGDTFLYAVHDWQGAFTFRPRRDRQWPPKFSEYDFLTAHHGVSWVYDRYFDMNFIHSAYHDPKARELIQRDEWGAFGYDIREDPLLERMVMPGFAQESRPQPEEEPPLFEDIGARL